jgi:hypothetical protein
MTYSARSTRYRGSRRRLARIRFTSQDKWLAVIIVLLCLFVIAANAWLGATYIN